jgi:hypothetical protein
MGVWEFGSLGESRRPRSVHPGRPVHPVQVQHFGELLLKEPGVEAAAFQKTLVTADFHDLPGVQNDDLVGTQDC